MMRRIESIVIGAGQSGLAAARALQAHGIRRWYWKQDQNRSDHGPTTTTA